MRPFTEKAYGIPPEQVIGTLFKTQYVMKPTGPVLMRLPSILSVDDGPGKPENIERFIGKKPIAVFGNSDGDAGVDAIAPDKFGIAHASSAPVSRQQKMGKK